MPVYMLLYVCYMHMIPSFHNKLHFHFKLVFESRPSNVAPAVLTKSKFFSILVKGLYQTESYSLHVMQLIRV